MHAIEIKQLCKTYDGGVEALKGIDLTIASGDFFALLGANGAGKSTTIGLISSLLTKTSGSIHICGIDLDKNPTKAKQYLGLVPQEINLNIFEACHQILINQAGYYGIPRQEACSRADELLKQLGLWHKKDTVVRRLSGGMKRRLMIARALMHRPRVLILDEPTAGVDIEIRHSMWEFLKRTNDEGTTIILTTHYLEEAEQLCKHIAIIDKGKLVENTSTQGLLNTLQHQTYVFNTENSINALPNLEPWEATQIDTHTFELRVDNQHSLNQVFIRLNEQGLYIHSLRNKTNRLEELFMDLIRHAKE
ncbi:MAG: ABC transporter ATP-binding protein [Gammaproteobacteria bacterium]|nr:ABC transporter ATP-binding protein [Gammaproteobacteria bacterium]